MRVPFHEVARRRERLRGLIRADGFLPVGEICRRLDISPATARRDLAAVAADGRITRTHGGALADYNAAFASVGERAGRARTAKGRVAAGAARQVPRQGVLFLDAGTTVQALARVLARRGGASRLVVVTNSLPVANVLGGVPGLELHVLGGTYLHRQAVLFGPEAIAALGKWRFAAAFLGGEGMDGSGVSNSHPEIAAFQRAVLQRTRAAWFLLDHTKLGTRTPHAVADWSRIGLVTDATVARLAAAGIHLPAQRLILV
ncbi:MAG TPA: DeoR/GlpR family DNA-binding transcription regulator [Candidatus Didemnitutus sp.]|nr:DeoR/GlpR family DNA-binding transcription regulator [Candidatus Didemnitutus sp.]